MTIFDSKAYKLYERLPRPTLRWIANGGALWALGLCDMFGSPLDSTERGVILGFVALVYGLRGWEKLKGQDNASTD